MTIIGRESSSVDRRCRDQTGAHGSVRGTVGESQMLDLIGNVILASSSELRWSNLRSRRSPMEAVAMSGCVEILHEEEGEEREQAAKIFRWITSVKGSSSSSAVWAASTPTAMVFESKQWPPPHARRRSSKQQCFVLLLRPDEEDKKP